MADQPGEPGPDVAVPVADGKSQLHPPAAVERRPGIGDDLVIQIGGGGARRTFGPMKRRRRANGIRPEKKFIEVDAGDFAANFFGKVLQRPSLQKVGSADDFVQGAAAELREDLADLLRDAVEERDDVLRFAAIFFAQFLVLGGDADGASVRVADAEHGASGGNERRGAEIEFLRAEGGGEHDVAAGLQAAVGAQGHPRSQAVQRQRLVRLGNAKFEGAARMLDGAQ
ncbi:MAG TPA: hypothetical protein VFU81_11190, partial [Thermomicrobiales bacterium]|nr:hypothetical protein [Thermomicrobiales bacterium]